MIVFDLTCDAGHRFEGWFTSSDDFMRQRSDGKLTCPICASEKVDKAPMAPAVGKKGNQAVGRKQVRETLPVKSKDAAAPMSNAPIPAEVAKAMEKLADAQASALKDSKWVGRKFAEESRAMHYGEQEHAPIHGEASPEEAKSLLEEGVPVAPLPFPVAPPDKLN